MDANDLVARGLEAHNNAQYAKAASFFLMAMLAAMHAFPEDAEIASDRLTTVEEASALRLTTEGAGKPKDAVGPWGR